LPLQTSGFGHELGQNLNTRQSGRRTSARRSISSRFMSSGMSPLAGRVTSRSDARPRSTPSSSLVIEAGPRSKACTPKDTTKCHQPLRRERHASFSANLVVHAPTSRSSRSIACSLWRHLRAPRTRLESAAPASNRSPIGKPELARRGSWQPQPVLPLASPDDWDAPPLAVGAPPAVLSPLELLPPAAVFGAPDAPAPPPPFVTGGVQPVAGVPPFVWDAAPPEASALQAS